AVNEKVLQAFEKSFKNASDVVWNEYKDCFEVKFLHNSIDSRITYDVDGNILRSIRYYGEEQLPLFVRAKLQKQYAGKTVFGVTELASEGELDYYIVLEDATSWNHVKCTSTGNMEMYKKFKKA
ncbi:MAG TPA: hypothetical protein VM843_06110, partial [Flavisolibacter sp.]|nr:hypothetical protein [Flavisolibacter sp.]